MLLVKYVKPLIIVDFEVGTIPLMKCVMLFC